LVTAHNNRAAIIGGGPAGLTQARALQKLGIEFTIFERNAKFGGLWNRDDPASPVYDSAHLISSRSMTGFDGFPMPESWADYPSAAKVLEYIQSFAAKFDLADKTRFNSKVERAEPRETGWDITVNGKTERFRWVIAASGSNWKPNLPNWPGSFSGTISHAASFRAEAKFTDQRVLVVGLGNSGADIACDISHVARRTAVSLRRGYHVIPKHILGKPADVFADNGPPLPIWLRQRVFQWLLRILVGDLGKFGMPKPDHRLMETHPLLSDLFVHHLRHGDIEVLGDIRGFDGEDVLFEDGRREGFDRVVCATGFEWEIPYIDPALLPWDRGRLDPPLAMFPNVNNLFLLSFIESNGSSFSLFNQMSTIIAHACQAEMNEPQSYLKLRMLLRKTTFDVTGGLNMQGTDRHVGYVDNRSYRKALTKLCAMMAWPTAARD